MSINNSKIVPKRDVSIAKRRRIVNISKLFNLYYGFFRSLAISQPYYVDNPISLTIICLPCLKGGKNGKTHN
jgi:hypothetical protein